ncbi:MAG: DUF4166 domain-containing protein [Chloroflexi bacterium]|nr:DUF4166 domain-containing protein [Chloroflexota bacterium]
MSSIYQRALGAEFSRLHPRIKQRFGFSSADHVAAIGRGIMEEVWRGPIYTLPFLALGAWRRIMFPEQGRNVPFTVENYAYVDGFGRETVTWLRTFHLPGRARRFDAYMVYGQQRGRVVDYLGTHQHLAVDIDLWMDEQGGLRLRSGAQRFYEGPIAFSFPLLFSGVANVREWYDDVAQRYRIEVAVRNDRWGPLFGYRGHFQVEWREVGLAGVPAHVKPRREERRE